MTPAVEGGGAAGGDQSIICGSWVRVPPASGIVGHSGRPGKYRLVLRLTARPRHDLSRHPGRDSAAASASSGSTGRRPSTRSTRGSMTSLGQAVAALRRRCRHRLHAAHRLREGVRGRRRHQGDGGQVRRRGRSWSDFTGGWDAVARARKPVVAAVAGFALGGGCELAMQCDLIIAADTAKFGQPEIKLGIMPGIGGTQRLPRAVGKAKAMDLILTGRMMDAAEAERSGLVARVVPAASLMEEAMKVAETIAAMSLPALHRRQGSRQPRLRDAARRGLPLRAPRVSARCSRPPTRRKAWRPSSRSGRRSSRTSDRHTSALVMLAKRASVRRRASRLSDGACVRGSRWSGQGPATSREGRRRQPYRLTSARRSPAPPRPWRRRLRCGRSPA